MRSILALVTVLTLLVPSAAGQCTLVTSPGGSGCGWSTPFGIPTIQCVGSPQLGNQSFAVTANVPCPMVASALMLGACRRAPLVIRSPFGVGGFCGPAEAVCALFLDPSAAVLIPGIPRFGGASFAIPVPNDPSLANVAFCAQELNLCSMAGGACLGASNTISITVH